MANPYIPRADAKASIWMQLFAMGIYNDPARFSISPAAAQSLKDWVDRFVEALRIATNESTRTKGTVAAKTDMRFAVEKFIQTYYMQIKLNLGISDADKIAIGVRPINIARTRIEVPLTSPMITVIGCTPGSQTLRFHDSIEATRKAKPLGAMQLQLFRTVGDDVARNPEDAKLIGCFTRNPVGVGFKHEDDRKKATYWARWVSRRGETGPWSLPASMSIAA
jgi:hypothetical protein